MEGRKGRKGSSFKKETSASTSVSQGERPKLTLTEQETLHLLTEEFLTVRAVSIRRNCTERAVRMIRKKLIRKGFLTTANTKTSELPQKGGVSGRKGSFSHPWRLHAEQFLIKIIWKDKRKYDRASGALITRDGNSIKCWGESLEVYSNTDFWGETPAECDANSQLYWMRFLNNLQSDLGVILVKERSQNIRRVRSEYAETNNGIARKFHREGASVRVFGRDGKVWLLFDNSKGLHEMETVHPQTSRPDADIAVAHLNDWRENQPPVASEMAAAIVETNKAIHGIAKAMESLTASMQVMMQANAPQRPPESPEKPSRDEVYYVG